uniref:Radial spoke head protein 3 homolog n=1 Tax=Mesocestoides corti TaxID=53468 RepID=A0A5K3EVS5_MESCO
MRSCGRNIGGVYTFASLPIARTVRLPLGHDDPRPPVALLNSRQESCLETTAPPGPPDCDGTLGKWRSRRVVNTQRSASREPKSIDGSESCAGGSNLVYGRSGQPVNLKQHLEEIAEPVQLDNFWSQTDEFMVRPPTPPFVPAKTGLDVATQVELCELFDFEIEVKPVLEVLTGKTMEQALVEVAEEEELQELRKQQFVQLEIHNAHLAEIERLEERNRRYREEQTRRKAQATLAASMRRLAADKVAARNFTKAYLEPLLPNVFEQLTERGYFYDSVESEIEQNFLKPILDSLFERNRLERSARLLVDGVIHEAVSQRHTEYRELGRHLMTEALVNLCFPKLAYSVVSWIIEEMVTLAVNNLQLAANARREILQSTALEIYNEVIDEAIEDLVSSSSLS